MSPSKDENIAKRYTEKGALVYFELLENIPVLNAEEYRNELREDEKEIILPPFCRIGEKKMVSEDKECKHYRVTLEAPQMESVPQEDLERLMEKTTEGFERNIQDIQTYDAIIFKIERLERMEDRADNEDRKLIVKDKKACYEQLHEIKGKVLGFRKDLQTLLKGLCKQKELEIDQAKGVIEADKARKLAEEAESARKAKVAEIISKMAENPQYANELNAQLVGTYQAFEENERQYHEKAETLGISYTKTMANTRIAERINFLQEVIRKMQEKLQNVEISEDASQETVDDIAQIVLPLVDGIRFGVVQTEVFPELVELHKIQSENEIKRNLYQKVHKTLREARMQKYTQEKEEIANEKIGFLGRLTGKSRLQEERKNQVQLKLELAKQRSPEKQEKYDVADMLVAMQVCAKTELDGKFSPEMADLYAQIRSFYPIREEEIEKKTQLKIREQQNQLPSVKMAKTGFFGKRKAQIEALEQENSYLKQQVIEEKQKPKNNFYQIADEQEALAGFEQKLKTIDRVTRAHVSIEKDGPTLELW